MAKPKRQDSKSAALARDGALNPHPEVVRDALFTGNPFFDPKDLVQVRYEMVRRHHADGVSISDVAAAFGISRPTFYKAQSTLADAGLAGLLPRPRGPKGGHKISAEVVAFVTGLKAETPDLTTPQCLGAIAARFGVRVHRRSLERALTRKKMTRPALTAGSTSTVDAYERLRAAVLSAEPVPGPGLAALRRQGMAAWITAPGATSDVTPSRSVPEPRPLPQSPPAASELTRLIASIVVALAAEPAHA